MIEHGCERVSFETHRPWRWWVWIDQPLPALLGRASDRYGRRPLPEGQFRFGRGGRCTTEGEGAALIGAAIEDAADELREFGFRPTHKLGANGELIPLTAPGTLELAP